MSQIGYMFFALGVGAWSESIFHLMTHAIFKALLFLTAGSIILALHHEQDIRSMGGLRRQLPIPFGVLSLAVPVWWPCHQPQASSVRKRFLMPVGNYLGMALGYGQGRFRRIHHSYLHFSALIFGIFGPQKFNHRNQKAGNSTHH